MATIQQLRQQLEKKSTFERAVNGLIEELGVSHATQMDDERWAAVKRCHALLKARYTGVNFWKTGLRLYKACEALPLDSSQIISIKKFQQEAGEFLGEEADMTPTTGQGQTPVDEASQPQRYAAAVDLQRTLLELYSRQAQSRRSHLSDAGLILDDTPPQPDPELERAAAAAYAALQESLNRAGVQPDQPLTHSSPSSASIQQPPSHINAAEPSADHAPAVSPSPQTPMDTSADNANADAVAADASGQQTTADSVTQDSREALPSGSAAEQHDPTPVQASEGQEGGERLATGSDTPGSAPVEDRTALQRSIFEGIEAVYAGMEAVARGTQAIEAQLDHLVMFLRSRHSDASSSGPPPASKRLVASLPRLSVTDALLEQWGKDTRCPVCTEQLQVGDVVMQLPCKHTYHPDCLQPWLDQHNSCPTCRHQLPTDDPVYEARKEREAEEAEERRGAENALSHNEFMYL